MSERHFAASSMPVLAALVIDGSDPRPVCLGCSAILFDKGMLVKRYERPFGGENQPVINGVKGEFTVVFYGVADGHTLAECQEEIGWRHIGPTWGT